MACHSQFLIFKNFLNMYASRSMRAKFLRETHLATDAELTYLDSILQLRRNRSSKDVELFWQVSDILDSWLFQGSWENANDSVLLNRISVTHIVNVTDMNLFDPSRQVLNIPSKDGLVADLSKFFNETNVFLDACHAQGCRALVNCRRGISRSSTIILAYLMHRNKWTLLQAYEYLLTIRPRAAPNPVLLLQLVRYENKLAKTNDEQ
jgi:hypothetical protein